MRLSISGVLLSFVLISGAHAEIYTWNSGSGTSYSDTPARLQPQKSNVVNIRTRAVRPAVAQPQKENNTDPNQQIIEQNKLTEERNKKIDEENIQNKADNCRAAKLNLQSAESARTANRESLMKHYRQDIDKFCN